MVVVEQPTGIIATGALVDGEIGGVFVSPDAQAAGLGARIMDELERIARESGLSFVNLDVSLPSRGFYEHRGYRVLEERSIDVGEGESLEYWRAAKRLAGES